VSVDVGSPVTQVVIENPVTQVLVEVQAHGISVSGDTSTVGIVAALAPATLAVIVEQGTADVTEEVVYLELVAWVPSITIEAPGGQGPEGPAGPVGPQGPAGPVGVGSGVYTHNQSAAASSWTVAHHLGYYPSISYIDAGGHAWIADVIHVDTDTAVLVFPSPVTGEAVCS